MDPSMCFLRTCHFIFALSLTRFALRNPNGITCGYAAFDLLLQNSSITKKVIDSFCFSLQNSSITKRCFVILERSEESQSLPFTEMFRFAQHDRFDTLAEMFRYAQHDNIVIPNAKRGFKKILSCVSSI